jgi:hypothetical protein
MNKNNDLIFEDTPWDLIAGKKASTLIEMKNRKASNNSLAPPFYN